MNLLKPSPQLMLLSPSSRLLPNSGAGNVKSSGVAREQLPSNRPKEFQDSVVNLTFSPSLSNELAEVPRDPTYSRSEAKATGPSLQSMVASAGGPVTGEKVTVSATGALFMESVAQPNPWQPSSFYEAVDYRKSCIERHKQTVEVLVDARAQGNVPESHLAKLEKAMLDADKRVFAAMEMCDQFRHP